MAPNPGQPLPHRYWPLSDDLRLHEWRVADRETDRRMRLEKKIDGTWRTAGPYVSGENTVQLMGALVRAYRDIAERIEARYRHPDLQAIEDGCPVCGAFNPRMVRVGDSFDLDCASCRHRAKMASYKVDVFTYKDW
ncbi:hypothetical protein [Salinisphaera hydrothermalis]|uniref:hypothetical protein n=1 Tax=Salinisphaera hydrothermalis TaxID=563188 RepID=UPI00333E910C